MFDRDFKFLRHLATSADLKDVSIDVENFHIANLGEKSFWRGGLKIRISGGKAAKLARELFGRSRVRGGLLRPAEQVVPRV